MKSNNRVLIPFISFTVFFYVILSCGFISVFIGKDLNFDLANYHYYNAYAFLHHRYNINYWPPSFIHVFFAPTADLLSYFLINYFSPINAVFLSGCIHGVNFWLIFLIAQCFLSFRLSGILFSLLITILSMYGAITFHSIGNFRNDLVVSLFVLSSVLLQIKYWQHYQGQQKGALFFLITASFLLGIALGLKLTAALFVIGANLSLLFLPIPTLEKCKLWLVIIFFILLGMLTSAGYWMFILWQKYHNPIFPFLNNIFHSVDYPPINIRYNGFIPNGWQAVFYPFYFSMKGTLADGYFRDFRFAILYILFCIVSVVFSYRQIYLQKVKYNLPLVWLLLFFIFSYLIGQFYFATIRYMVALEMLAPLMIFLLIYYLFPNKKAYYLFAIIFLLLVVSLKQSTIETRVKSYGNDYFNVTLPEIASKTPEALVLMSYTMYTLSSDPRPQTYLIPFLPKDWQYIGIPFHEQKFIYPGGIIFKKIEQLIQLKSDKIFLLTMEETMPELIRVAKKLNLKPTGQCGKIFSERQLVNLNNVLLCEVKKVFLKSTGS